MILPCVFNVTLRRNLVKKITNLVIFSAGMYEKQRMKLRLTILLIYHIRIFCSFPRKNGPY